MRQAMTVDQTERGWSAAGDAGGGETEVASWVRRAREGDLDAFERIYGTYHRRIYGLCLRMAGDATTAEELTQDSFVRAWQKLHLYEPTWSFGSWLHKVATNVVLGDRRASRRRARWIAADEGIEPVADSESSTKPDASLDLERAMAQLPPKARAVFVLHDVEGHQHREIARLTGMAVGTSKAQLHRARRILREALRS
jgi:RNA polymerase sigma-70 factor (ECF subfamily)